MTISVKVCCTNTQELPICEMLEEQLKVNNPELFNDQYCHVIAVYEIMPSEV